jgi:hypothetical protein
VTLLGSLYTKSRPIYFTKGLKLIRSYLNSIVSIKSLFKKFLIVHSKGGFLLWFLPNSSCYQTSRQTQRGREFGWEVKGCPLLWHTRKSNMHSLSVTLTGSPVQELHLHMVFTCFAHLWLLPLCLLATVSPYKPWTGGPVRAHPRPYEFTMDPQLRTPHLLHSQVLSHSHTFTCRHPMSRPHPSA